MTGAIGREAEAEAARGARVGARVFLNPRPPHWSFVCPFYATDGCGLMYDEYETADVAWAGWAVHAHTRHPGRPTSRPGEVGR